MIVELFGPPGSGKTTMARMLADGLKQRGCDARTMVSARASEADAAESGPRFMRRRDPDPLGRELLRLLPPRGWFWALRLRRYLAVLATAWQRSEALPAIIVFDQGYTQALCSLISLSPRADPGRIREALALVPPPTFRVCLQVRPDVLAARVAARSRGMTLRERVLELDAATALRQDGICAMLFDALEGGFPMARPAWSDPTHMTGLLDAIMKATAPAASCSTTRIEAHQTLHQPYGSGS